MFSLIEFTIFEIDSCSVNPLNDCNFELDFVKHLYEYKYF